MTAVTKEQLHTLYKNLPQDIREVYSSEETTNTLEAIGKKHNLHVDMLGELVSETGYVLVGATRPENYVENLTKRLAVEKEKARAIADDVNKEVFQSIRESLKKIHELKKKDRVSTPQKDAGVVKTEEEYSVPRPTRGRERKLPIKRSAEEPKKITQKEPDAPMITPQKREPLDPRREDGENPNQKPSASQEINLKKENKDTPDPSFKKPSLQPPREPVSKQHGEEKPLPSQPPTPPQPPHKEKRDGQGVVGDTLRKEIEPKQKDVFEKEKNGREETPPSTESGNKYTGGDPYREPIE